MMAAQAFRVSRFGLLANAGALLSVLMCYGKLAVIAALSLTGIAVVNINPHLQAALMVGFALLAVSGLAIDYRHHRDYAPLAIGATGLAVMAVTLYVSYNTRAEFLAYACLIVAVFMNQHAALKLLTAQLRQHSEEIADKNRQLEAASRHKSDFLASMSHELRTPLNAILGFNEMILDQVYGPLSPEVKSPLEEMQSSGKHLLRLINNVLDLAKIEAGRMELAFSDYSVQDTVESVRATLRPIAAEKGLELRTFLPSDIPLARGDAGRISQCLLNLAGNALKFTKAGRVEIGVQLVDHRLVYRVTDTGIGIPPDKIGGLFSEFKQADATIASEYGGTGLGLAITKRFIEMHGGRIWVESEPGRGSTFLFEIPLRA